MNRKTTLAAFAALLLTAGTASAAPPPVFTYGGFLLDGAGNPVATPTNLTFRFHDALTGGSPLGTDDVVTVDPGADGYFTAIVGVGMVGFPALFDGQVYMSIQAEGDAQPMTPRIPITSVPSALAVDFGGISGWPSQTCTGYVKEIGSNGLAVCDSAPPLTGVSAGTGITATVTGGTVALAVDTAAIQARISAAGCASGSSIRVVNANGTVVCQTDTVGTGTVTGVTGTAPIVVTTSTTTPAVSLKTCGANEVYKMNAGGTAWGCASDAVGTGTVTSIATGDGLTGGPITTTGTLSVAFPGTGAPNGTATTAARSDHWHNLGVSLGCSPGVDTVFYARPNHRITVNYTSPNLTFKFEKLNTSYAVYRVDSFDGTPLVGSSNAAAVAASKNFTGFGAVIDATITFSGGPMYRYRCQQWVSANVVYCSEDVTPF